MCKPPSFVPSPFPFSPFLPLLSFHSPFLPTFLPSCVPLFLHFLPPSPPTQNPCRKTACEKRKASPGGASQGLYIFLKCLATVKVCGVFLFDPSYQIAILWTSDITA